jgi:hypothetical protein
VCSSPRAGKVRRPVVIGEFGEPGPPVAIAIRQVARGFARAFPRAFAGARCVVAPVALVALLTNLVHSPAACRVIIAKPRPHLVAGALGHRPFVTFAVAAIVAVIPAVCHGCPPAEL